VHNFSTAILPASRLAREALWCSRKGLPSFNAWGDLEDLVVPGLSACLGATSEMLLRHTLRRVGSNVVVATRPGIAGVGSVGVNAKTGLKTPVFHPLLTNTAAMLAGARRYYNRIGRDVTMLVLEGMGARGCGISVAFRERRAG